MATTSTQDINEKLIGKGRTDLRLIGEHKGARVKSLFACLNCRNEWLVTSGSVLSGVGCPKCAKLKLAKSQALTAEEIARRLDGSGLRLASAFIGMNAPVSVQCLTCGDTRHMKTANAVLRAKIPPARCAHCFPKTDPKRLSHAVVQQQIWERKPHIHMVDHYAGDGVRIRFRCDLDGCEWITTPSHIKRDTGCPHCARLAAGTDSLQSVIDGSLRLADRSCWFYLFDLHGFSGFIKPGITTDIDRRKRESKGVYGDAIGAWVFETRDEAVAVETAFLEGTRLSKRAPAKLHKACWQGVSELRAINADEAVAFAEALVEELQELGLKGFLLKRVRLAPDMRRALEAAA